MLVKSTRTVMKRARRRKPARWAFVPGGSTLEKRLRGLMKTGADVVVQRLMSEVDETEDDDVMKGVVNVQVHTSPLRREVVDVDYDHVRCVSQELPHVVSQMSEGLEILLRASQDTMDFGLSKGLEE